MERENVQATVVARYLKPVRRFASFLARTDFDPDDLVGEAMLAGVKRSRSGEDPDCWNAWFNGVVRNLVRRRIRQKGRRRAGWKPEEGYLVDPLRRFQEEELRTAVNGAVSRLPEGGRAVFELALRGCSRPEIARRLNLSLAAVHARWFRGLRRLQSELPSEFRMGSPRPYR